MRFDASILVFELSNEKAIFETVHLIEATGIINLIGRNMIQDMKEMLTNEIWNQNHWFKYLIT